MSPSNPVSGLRELCRGQKDCKSQSGWRTPRKQGSVSTTVPLYIRTHRGYGFVPGGVPAQRGDVNIRPHGIFVDSYSHNVFFLLLYKFAVYITNCSFVISWNSWMSLCLYFFNFFFGSFSLVDCFVLFQFVCLVLSYFIIILEIPNCFPNRGSKGWIQLGGKVGKVKKELGEEKSLSKYAVLKQIYFQQKKKLKNKNHTYKYTKSKYKLLWFLRQTLFVEELSVLVKRRKLLNLTLIPKY